MTAGFKPGDLVFYWPVLDELREPVKAIIVKEIEGPVNHPSSWLVDGGPTGYSEGSTIARRIEATITEHLSHADGRFPFTLDEMYDRYIAYAARNDLELSKDEFEVNGEELTLDGMDPGEWIEAMTMD